MADNKDIEKVSRAVFDNLKMDPPDNAWDKLDADLDKKQSRVYKQRSNRFKLLSIALLLIIFSFVTWQYILPTSATKNLSNVSTEKNIVFNKNPSTNIDAENNLTSTVPAGKRINYKNVKEVPEHRKEKENSSKFDKSQIAELPFEVKPINKMRNKNLIQNQNNQNNYINFQADKNENITKAISTNVNAVSNQLDNNSLDSGKKYATELNSLIIPIADNTLPTLTDSSKLESTNFDNTLPTFSDSSKLETTYTNNSLSILTESSKIEPANADNALPDSNKSEPEYFVNKDSLFQKDSQSKSRLSLAVYYSPNQSWCNLEDNTNDEIDDVAMYNNRESSKFSFATGLNLKYDLSTKWSLIIGAAYSTIAKSITIQTMYAKANSNNDMHFEYPTSNGVIEVPSDDTHPHLHSGDSINAKADCKQSIKFINVPLMVRFQVTKKRFTGYINAGLSANFIVQEKAKIFMNNSETTIINRVRGLKKMNYGFLIGTGVQFNMYDDFGIFIEPMFRGSFTSITQNMTVNSYPYSLGLNLGFSLHF